MDVKYLRYTYSIALCGLSLIFVVPSIIFFTQLNDADPDIKSINKTWVSDIVTEMKIIFKNDSCPQGFEDDLFTFSWPGTQKGCNCQLSKQVQAGQCCAQGSDNGCVTCQGGGQEVPEIQPIKFTSFAYSEQLKTYFYKGCVRRLKGFNYLNKAPLVSYCDSVSERECGGHDINKTTLFCVPKSEQCPITSIFFGNRLPINLTHLKPNGSFGTYFLYIGRNESKMPLISTQISEGSGVCLDNNQMNVSPTREIYPLYNKSAVAHCSEFDKSYVRTMLDKVDERLFFQANDALYLEKMLPYYNLSSSFYYQHFYKQIENLSYECRLPLRQLGSNKTLKDILKSSATYLLIFVALLVGFYILYEFWFVWYYNRKFSNSYVGVIIFKKVGGCEIVHLVLKILLQVGILVSLIHVDDDLKRVYTNFSMEGIIKECFTAQMAREVIQYQEKMNLSILFNVLQAAIIMSFLLEPNLIYAFIYIIRKFQDVNESNIHCKYAAQKTYSQISSNSKKSGSSDSPNVPSFHDNNSNPYDKSDDQVQSNQLKCDNQQQQQQQQSHSESSPQILLPGEIHIQMQDLITKTESHEYKNKKDNNNSDENRFKIEINRVENSKGAETHSLENEIKM